MVNFFFSLLKRLHLLKTPSGNLRHRRKPRQTQISCRQWLETMNLDLQKNPMTLNDILKFKPNIKVE